MTVNVFGVDADSVRRHCFPHFDSWSTETAPTAVTVTEKIQEQAGFLAGHLLVQGVTAWGIEPTSAAYSQCSSILRLMVALDLARSIPGQETTLATVWEKTVTAWLKALEENGATFLGDASLAGDSNANGPASHIEYYGLTPPDTADASSLEPFFRKDDML